MPPRALLIAQPRPTTVQRRHRQTITDAASSPSGRSCALSSKTNRAELKGAPEQFIRDALRRHLPAGTPIYLYGSRARGDAAWSSECDLWVEADLPEHTLVDVLDEILTTPRLRGRFGQHVRAEAKSWI